MKNLVVILPTYNERRSIIKTIQEVLDQEKELPGYKISVVVADSFSPDNTAEEVTTFVKKHPQVHLISVERGLGIGLIKGHLYSLEHLNPDVMAQLDADGQVEADVLVRLTKAIEEGYDIGLGSRFIKGGRNQLSFARRIFSGGSSFVCRLIMGPWNIKEFTNSARAFTPSLFKKINLNRLPWKERTFIIQPAFLNESVVAGAKYKEVPLVFKDRAEGYSKNKVLNYTFDILTYVLDARLHKLGIDIPLFKLSRKFKTFFKFGMVGVIGTAIDFGFYNLFILKFGITPATAKAGSAEIAIINNFILNNSWTFKHRKTETTIVRKFLTFNLISLGGLIISVLIIKALHLLYGDGVAEVFRIKIPYYNIYFLASILPVLTWNFTANHFITWRHKEIS